jgi:HEAT repeat protein
MTAVGIKLAWLMLLASCASVLLGQTPQDRAWSILQAGVNNRSTERRTEAMRALGLLRGSQKPMGMLQKASRDKEPEVRVAAATALGQLGSKASIPTLRKMLSDNDPAVVLAAAHALWILNDSVAYDVFYEELTGERKSAEGLVGQGMETLKDKKEMAKLSFEQGIGFFPFVDLGYSAAKVLTKDERSPVRAEAARILADDKDPRSGKALVHAASDKKWIVRVAALEAIANRGDARLLSGIVPAMSDENETVRLTAAATVFRLAAIAKATGLAKNEPSVPERQERQTKIKE